MKKKVDKYSKLLNELTSDDILEGFIGYGLFPDKCPNFLSSEAFFEWYKSEGFKDFTNKGNDYIRYESLRDTNVPRAMGIPNPFAYANLCKHIADNWDKIKNHLKENVKGQKHKVSRIHIRKLEKKSQLFEMNYKNGEKDGYPEDEIHIGKRYFVEADISGCFPSIYSHSIPWALIGKEKSKGKFSAEDKWVDKLDEKLRNTKHKETNGILIGPHVSNLISEIILVKVDNALYDRYKFVRFVDDYKCYVDTQEQAESFLLDLSQELKKYELSLNTKKTRIAPMPQSSVANWVNRLNNFYIGDDYTDDKEKPKIVFKLKRLKSFIDLAIELMLEHNASTPLNYAFKIVASSHLGEEAIQYYVNQTHHLLLLYPYLARIMEETVIEPFNVDFRKIKTIATSLYKVGIDKRLYEAASYAVYWSLKYDFNFRRDIFKDALASDDCIFLTLAYLYAKNNKKEENIAALREKALELKELDLDRYWIFVYETLKENDLDEDFKSLKKAKISFVKSFMPEEF